MQSIIDKRLFVDATDKKDKYYGFQLVISNLSLFHTVYLSFFRSFNLFEALEVRYRLDAFICYLLQSSIQENSAF